METQKSAKYVHKIKQRILTMQACGSKVGNVLVVHWMVHYFGRDKDQMNVVLYRLSYIPPKVAPTNFDDPP